MKRNQSKPLENNGTMRIAIAAFLLICVVMGVLCFNYYRHLQDTVKVESSEYLQEISTQLSANADKIITDNFSVLGTISTVLKNANVNTYQQLQPIVQEQQRYWKYQDIFLVDKNGIAYDAFGMTVALTSDVYLQEAIVNEKQTMSSTQVINGTECVVFALPVKNIMIDGNDMCVLMASYDLVTFDQILSMSAFDGKADVHIINKDGSIVVRSNSKNAKQFGYNVLNSLTDAEMDKGDSFAQVKSDIAAGKKGAIGLTLNGLRQYMAYTPLTAQEQCLLTFVPVSVVSAKSGILMNITLTLCGFITLSFAVLIVFLVVAFTRHKRKLEQIAYVDPVTGGNTIQRFYQLSEASLHLSDKPQFALVYINIEKFKVLNEQFGRNACDGMLCSIEKGISNMLSKRECIGRLSADNFCLLAEYQDETLLLKRFTEWYANAERIGNSNGFVWLSPIVEFGVFVISNDTMPFNQMIDRAKLALRETMRTLHGKLHYAIYDDAVRMRLFREKQLEDMMEDSLNNNEFRVFLQPKYLAKSEQIGGAEALVRWSSPIEGMIYPDEFISLFEKNGFIIQLDLWVFGEVCRMIRGWLDEGRKPVKISVNCSRVHLCNDKFLDQYIEICKRFNVPPSYLEIELTENIVFENVEYLTKTIDRIHTAGFGCSMDDFGSGYSSLNLIQDIPVDTIKLDKIFFHSNTRDMGRMESVVGSIISMTKLLSMETVAEGVELKEQVDMLKRLGCNYIQGYYFAKPMPIVEFEQLLFDSPQEKEGVSI